jgi:hypothetical protein
LHSYNLSLVCLVLVLPPQLALAAFQNPLVYCVYCIEEPAASLRRSFIPRSRD